jgi:hypothetical protein
MFWRKRKIIIHRVHRTDGRRLEVPRAMVADHDLTLQQFSTFDYPTQEETDEAMQLVGETIDLASGKPVDEMIADAMAITPWIGAFIKVARNRELWDEFWDTAAREAVAELLRLGLARRPAPVPPPSPPPQPETATTATGWDAEALREGDQAMGWEAEALREEIAPEAPPEPARPPSRITLYAAHLKTLGLFEMPGDQRALRDAYILCCKTKHPDRGGSTAEFAALRQAYESLSKALP